MAHIESSRIHLDYHAGNLNLSFALSSNKQQLDSSLPFHTEYRRQSFHLLIEASAQTR